MNEIWKQPDTQLEVNNGGEIVFASRFFFTGSISEGAEEIAWK